MFEIVHNIKILLYILFLNYSKHVAKKDRRIKLTRKENKLFQRIEILVASTFVLFSVKRLV